MGPNCAPAHLLKSLGVQFSPSLAHCLYLPTPPPRPKRDPQFPMSPPPSPRSAHPPPCSISARTIKKEAGLATLSGAAGILSRLVVRVQPRKERQDRFTSPPPTRGPRERWVPGFHQTTVDLIQIDGGWQGHTVRPRLDSSGFPYGQFPYRKQEELGLGAIQRNTEHLAHHLKTLTGVGRLCPAGLAQVALRAPEDGWYLPG